MHILRRGEPASSQDKVDRILAIAGEPLSMDASLNTEATRFLGNAIEDVNLMDPFKFVVSRSLRTFIDR